MGTNCAPLLADLFLYSYEAEFIQKLLHEKKKSLAVAFNSTFRYIDDVLSVINNQFQSHVDSIYPNELEIKDTTESFTSASYLDVLLKLDTNGKITIQLYDKRDDFNFSIVNFPYLCSNIPASPAYGVYIATYSICKCLLDIRSVFSSRQSIDRQVDVTGVSTVSFTGNFPQLYGRYNDLICPYNLSLGHMLSDMFHTNR
jgi:hypothetical protein